MRAIRITHWAPDLSPGITPGITMVMRESDLQVPIEEAAKPAPGVFQTSDIFELTTADVIAPTLEANARMTSTRRERERNMAMLYYYNLFSPNFDMVTPGGIMTQTVPSPLSVEEIKAVFEQIKIAPRFKQKRVTMIARSETMKIVTLTADGEIKEG